MKKNVSGQVIGGQMVSATDGSAFTGSVTVYVTGDGGTQAVGSVGSGACTHEGNGYHTYAPAQAETNYDLVAFTFIGTGAVPATVQCSTEFPQSGDAFARLGAPVGASISADVAGVKTQTGAIETDTQDIQTRLPAALVGGRMDSYAGAIADGLLTAAKFASGAFDAVWSVATRLLTAGTNIVLAKGTGLTGFNDLDAAGVRTAVGLASANLDTQLTDLPTNAEMAALLAAADDAVLAAIAALNNLSAAGVRAAVGLASANLDTQLTAISGKTTNLPTDPADQSLIIDATNSILAAVAALNNLSAAGVRAAVGLASANLDTQLTDLPTNAELATALAAADDAVLTQLGLIKDKTDLIPASPAAVGSAMTLTSGERDSIAAAQLDLANAIETGLTLRQALRLIAAATAGKLSGAATATIIVRNAVADNKDRITATVDTDGNRSAITVDLT